MKYVLKVCLLFLVTSFFLFSQKNKHSYTKNNYPEQFEIKKQEIENLCNVSLGEKITTNNLFLKNSRVLYKNKVNENIQLKLKLDYIKGAELILQKNGNSSLIIFIVDDKNNIYYTNNLNGEFLIDKWGNVIIKKCSKDDIVSE